MTSKITITIASVPDREKLVAELWVGHRQWAELSQENETLLLEIYPSSGNSAWSLDYEDTMNGLMQAKQKLTGNL